ncbi:hypothetical protein DZD52_15115 [Xanthomonas nasturtii]|uniref:Uncharacterized protein n=1 Tax=Xanthomonas nasturtii TaxID=1843581 RepID=A0A3E1KH74_9XANT|nr:hypothetical protein DZD52_15115 [Xanthomonas nasturtii]
MLPLQPAGLVKRSIEPDICSGNQCQRKGRHCMPIHRRCLSLRHDVVCTLQACSTADRTPRQRSDVPPILSSAAVWSPIPYPKEIGREEAFY